MVRKPGVGGLREGGGLGTGWGKGSPAPPPLPPLPPPLGEAREGGSQGSGGGHLTFPDGAVRGGSVVGEEEAGSVPAVAAPAPGGDGALVFRGHGGLVDGWAVLVGERGGCWVPVGAGICVPRVGQRHKGKSEAWELTVGTTPPRSGRGRLEGCEQVTEGQGAWLMGLGGGSLGDGC